LKLHPSFFKGGEATTDCYEPLRDFKPGFRDNFVLLVCSFFSGPDVFHVLARLNKKTRENLLISGLVDQEKMLTVKPNKDFDDLIGKIKYGLQLADTINFNFNGTLKSESDPVAKYYTLIFGAICALNEFGTRNISICTSECSNKS
jgi:hypothetical protein